MVVSPFDLYLDKWVADFEHRIEASGISQLLHAAGARAAERLQAAGVNIGARHRNLRPGINVSKQFGAKWAQKKHGKSYAKSVAAALARNYPKKQTRRSSSSQGTRFNKP
jgi:hypothetical protein